MGQGEGNKGEGAEGGPQGHHHLWEMHLSGLHSAPQEAPVIQPYWSHMESGWILILGTLGDPRILPRETSQGPLPKASGAPYSLWQVHSSPIPFPKSQESTGRSPPAQLPSLGKGR